MTKTTKREHALEAEHYAAYVAMHEMRRELFDGMGERCRQMSAGDRDVATIHMLQETARMERLLDEHHRAIAAFTLGQAEREENNEQGS